jgi:hypothetical protein
MMGLTLNPPLARGINPAPMKPTLIPAIPLGPAAFNSVFGLARAVHMMRGGRGLRIKPTYASYDASDTFPCFTLYAIGEDGDERYLAVAVAPGLDVEAFQRTIADANPDQIGVSPRARRTACARS